MHLFIAAKSIGIFLFSLLLSTFSQAVLLDPFEAKSAPISDFIKWASFHSNSNIIQGKNVKGTVSVNIVELDSSDVMTLFTQVMRSNGYNVTFENGSHLVTENSESPNSEIPLISKVFKFNNIKSNEASIFIDSFFHSIDKKHENENIIKSKVSSVNNLPRSNSLLITSTESNLNLLEAHINDIDTEYSQILIEAIILETDLGNSESFGANLSNILSSSGFNLISNTSLTGNKLGLGGHATYSSDGDIDGVISAVSKDENTKILSTPKILVLDRESGHISVGQNVPFLVSKEVTDGGNSVQQIERKDIGITLSVTPHLLGNKNIILRINQESSSITNSTLASDIITNKRSISTVAKVKDGQTISLGGLVSEETRSSESGIPILKDIPIFGGLFRSRSNETVQREMTVLIKTKVI